MTISITATPTVLLEEEATQVAITLTSSEPIPSDGLIVSVDSDVENALGQFDLFTTQFENVQLIGINDDTSGFVVLLSEQTGTIISPVVDDNDADSPQNLTFNVEPGEGYTVDENAGSVTVTIEDADDLTIPTPDNDEEIPTIEPVFGSVDENFPLAEVTIAEINQAFDAGTLTSEELVQLYLNRIEAFDQQGPSINSIITINPEALAIAAELDVERQLSGARSPLHGIPILIKDNIDTFDLPTSAGSFVLENSIPPDDAFVIEELREAGAIILGKANLDEFARGAEGLSSVGGQTLNPYALNRIPGGSSAGTAAAVASNFAILGLGTETGVSIRNPAANNNLVGIAPTEGLVSRDGVVPISFTQDRVGPLARTVTDAAIALDVIAGFDENDPVTENSIGNIPEAGYTSLLSTTALEGARIGVFRDLFRSGEIHAESLAIIENAIDDFEAQGATVIDNVSLGFDLFDFLSDARVNIFEFKFALNDYLTSLGSNAPVKTLQDIIDDGRYLPRLRNSFLLSQSIESLEDNPQYLERLSQREFLRDATIEIMEELDLDALIYPMKTVPAPIIGETPPESDNPFTSIAGLPGIVVPAGFTSEGLPVGLEISGKPFSEALLLGLAYDYEQATLHRTSLNNLIEINTIMPIISFTTDPELLIESEETFSLLNFNLSEPPPESEITVIVGSPDLPEFNLNQIQTEGGTINLNNEAQSLLETTLNQKKTDEVPGVTIAITSPLGDWSEAVGVANIENDTPLTTSDRFEIGSITKVFTATTILKLVEAGIVSLEDTLTDWLPEEVTANVPNSSEITLRQLLNHTSGIAEYDVILLQQAQTNPAIFLRDWQPEEIINLISDVEPFFAPGESWQYSNTNYTLAGMVIEAATGNNIAAEMRSRIFDPLNLENTFFADEEEIPGGYVSGYFDFDGDGNLDDISITNLSWAWTNGAIVSNTEDLTEFAKALYQGDLLSEDSLAQMFTLVDTGRGYDYGLGMMSFETPDLGRVVGHRGGTIGFNSNMWYSSEDDFTYVDLANGRTNERLVDDTIPAFTEGAIPTIGNTTAYNEFNFTITEQDAQISLPVLNDGVIEGEETATFTIEPGEGYEVNADASSGTFTIIDTADEIEPEPLQPEPIFGSIEGDIIEVSGKNKLVFGGSSDDLIDAAIGSEGGNRIYGSGGDDTFILGIGDRIFGGDGDDKFYATSGGDNLITGGAGADQFWIAVAEIPDAANSITDFTIGEDVLGIAGLGIGFSDLSITGQDGNTLIAANGSDLAILQGISADNLSESDFVFT